MGSCDAILNGQSGNEISQKREALPFQLTLDIGDDLGVIDPGSRKRRMLFGQTVEIGGRHAQQIADAIDFFFASQAGAKVERKRAPVWIQKGIPGGIKPLK